MKRPLFTRLICTNSQELNCTLMFGKVLFRLSQILATSYMVLIKLVHSAVLIHPHHTINAEGCQIASFKQRDCNKALTLIRTNVGQEKEQTEAEPSLVRTQCGGLSEEGGAGVVTVVFGNFDVNKMYI